MSGPRLQINSEIFHIFSLNGAISIDNPFLFSLELVLPKDFPIDDWVNLPASVLLASTHWVGRIYAVYWLDTGRCQIDFGSGLYQLKHHTCHTLKIHRDKTFSAFTQEYLQPYGYAYYQCDFSSLSSPLPERDYRVQVPGETDWDFFKRQLAREEIFFIGHQDPHDYEQLCFYHNTHDPEPIIISPLPTQPFKLNYKINQPTQLQGYSHHCLIQPGRWISFNNQTWCITQIQLSITQSLQRVIFLAIPSDAPYPCPVAIYPRVATTWIEPYDARLPRLTPSADSWHMPIPPDTHVLVGALAGNPDNRIILQIIPKRPLLTPNQTQQGAWQTPNQQTWDTNSKQETMTLALNHQASLLDFNKQAIKLAANQADLNINAQDNMTYHSLGELNHISQGQVALLSQQKQTWQAQSCQINCARTTNLDTRQNLSLTAQKNIQQQTGDIAISCQQAAKLTCQQSQIKSPRGQSLLRAGQKVSFNSLGEIILKLGQAHIILTQDGVIKLHGPSIQLASANISWLGTLNYCTKPPSKTPHISQLHWYPLPQLSQLTDKHPQKILNPHWTQDQVDIKDQAIARAYLQGFPDKTDVKCLIYACDKPTPQQPDCYSHDNICIEQLSLSIQGNIVSIPWQLDNLDHPANYYRFHIQVDDISATMLSTPMQWVGDCQIEFIDQWDRHLETQTRLKLPITAKPEITHPDYPDLLTPAYQLPRPSQVLALNIDDSRKIHTTVNVLAPPLVFNFRDQVMPRLTEDLIHYLKQQKKLSLVIHGFNVSLGHYGQHIDKIIHYPQTEAVYLDKITQCYRDADYLSQCFADYRHNTVTNNLNGSGAHQWLLNLEYYLNKARGFEENYQAYPRFGLITWTGNPASALDYMTAVTQAKQAGELIGAWLKQLKLSLPQLDIEVIAHSLGCQVLLTACEQCPAGLINHIILWQGALSHNSLLDAQLMRVGQKITVLHSLNDNILGPIPKYQPTGISQSQVNCTKPLAELITALLCRELDLGSIYHLANWLGVPCSDLLGSHKLPSHGITLDRHHHWLTKLNNSRGEIAQALKAAGHTKLATLTGGLGIYLAYLGRLETTHPGSTLIKQLDQLCTVAEQLLAKTPPEPALGWAGPSHAVKQAYPSLRIIDQTDCLWSHAGMLDPTNALFEQVFKKL